VFADSGGSWTQVAVLKGGDTAAGDRFASSVAISPDGSTVIAGAPDHAGGGSAYVFGETSGSWSAVAELTGSDTAAGDGFGTSVGVGDSTAVVGAPGHGGGGAAYLFSTADGWVTSTRQALDGAGAAGAGSGASVSLAGSVVLVGEPDARDNGADGAGDAYTVQT
jgi:hypothetical protein